MNSLRKLTASQVSGYCMTSWVSVFAQGSRYLIGEVLISTDHLGVIRDKITCL